MFSLDRVVPWKRSFDGSRRAFGLDDSDLTPTPRGGAGGPAGFNTDD
jgi:hypothetical protein